MCVGKDDFGVEVAKSEPHCPACDSTWEAEEPLMLCPRRQEAGVGITGGDELVLEPIEYLAPIA